ncbi:hypothetical protein BLNAU_6982 [Blattamonas nauphoetae]|uniref:non-specific serine/threonine protein kinase n=1 Tax=Blattamonas nauphoetae TaxID=2049346 RepID=A0ABQ9Y2V1_9EUKA|nr:hypothetical protein BLNAU_6982 [Blattamonas nauphoetae]
MQNYFTHINTTGTLEDVELAKQMRQTQTLQKHKNDSIMEHTVHSSGNLQQNQKDALFPIHQHSFLPSFLVLTVLLIFVLSIPCVLLKYRHPSYILASLICSSIILLLFVSILISTIVRHSQLTSALKHAPSFTFTSLSSSGVLRIHNITLTLNSINKMKKRAKAADQARQLGPIKSFPDAITSRLTDSLDEDIFIGMDQKKEKTHHDPKVKRKRKANSQELGIVSRESEVGSDDVNVASHDVLVVFDLMRKVATPPINEDGSSPPNLDNGILFVARKDPCALSFVGGKGKSTAEEKAVNTSGEMSDDAQIRFDCGTVHITELNPSIQFDTDIPDPFTQSADPPGPSASLPQLDKPNRTICRVSKSQVLEYLYPSPYLFSISSLLANEMEMLLCALCLGEGGTGLDGVMTPPPNRKKRLQFNTPTHSLIPPSFSNVCLSSPTPTGQSLTPSASFFFNWRDTDNNSRASDLSDSTSFASYSFGFDPKREDVEETDDDGESSVVFPDGKLSSGLFDPAQKDRGEWEPIESLFAGGMDPNGQTRSKGSGKSSTFIMSPLSFCLDKSSLYVLHPWPGKPTLYSFLKAAKEERVPFMEDDIWDMGARLLTASSQVQTEIPYHGTLNPQCVTIHGTDYVEVGMLYLTAILREPARVAIDGVSSWPYYSPEQVGDQPVQRECDVYAVGMMLIEMCMLKTPTPSSKLPTILSSPIRKWIRSMVNSDPTERPSISELLLPPRVARVSARMLSIVSPFCPVPSVKDDDTMSIFSEAWDDPSFAPSISALNDQSSHNPTQPIRRRPKAKAKAKRGGLTANTAAPTPTPVMPSSRPSNSNANPTKADKYRQNEPSDSSSDPSSGNILPSPTPRGGRGRGRGRGKAMSTASSTNPPSSQPPQSPNPSTVSQPTRGRGGRGRARSRVIVPAGPNIETATLASATYADQPSPWECLMYSSNAVKQVMMTGKKIRLKKDSETSLLFGIKRDSTEPVWKVSVRLGSILPEHCGMLFGEKMTASTELGEDTRSAAYARDGEVWHDQFGLSSNAPLRPYCTFSLEHNTTTHTLHFFINNTLQPLFFSNVPTQQAYFAVGLQDERAECVLTNNTFSTLADPSIKLVKRKRVIDPSEGFLAGVSTTEERHGLPEEMVEVVWGEQYVPKKNCVIL